MPAPDRALSIRILSCGRVGDLKQMQALAQALGWPTEIRRLETSKGRLLGAPRVTAAALASLAGQPPDLILCAERAAAVAALEIKRRHPAVKVVCLARPRGHFDSFDLIITTPQYALPGSPNILEVNLPLTAPVQPSRPRQGQPVALLVGGTSAPYRLDAPAAGRMAEDVKRHAARQSLAISGSTSARTGPEAARILKQAFEEHAAFHIWQAGKPNPYGQLLQDASEVIVTADSVSMVADAIAAGKPVSIYPLPEEWGLGHRIVRALWRRARRRDGSLSARLAWPLFDSGLLEARADRGALHQALAAKGLAAHFPNPPPMADASLFGKDMAVAVARVMALFGA